MDVIFEPLLKGLEEDFEVELLVRNKAHFLFVPGLLNLHFDFDHGVFVVQNLVDLVLGAELRHVCAALLDDFVTNELLLDQLDL